MILHSMTVHVMVLHNGKLIAFNGIAFNIMHLMSLHNGTELTDSKLNGKCSASMILHFMALNGMVLHVASLHLMAMHLT